MDAARLSSIAERSAGQRSGVANLPGMDFAEAAPWAILVGTPVSSLLFGFLALKVSWFRTGWGIPAIIALPAVVGIVLFGIYVYAESRWNLPKPLETTLVASVMAQFGATFIVFCVAIGSLGH
jgi:hypothetical protein